MVVAGASVWVAVTRPYEAANTAAYTPRHSADTLPAEWRENAPVQVRMKKHYMFLKRPSGDELQLTITKQKPAPPAQKAPEPAATP